MLTGSDLLQRTYALAEAQGLAPGSALPLSRLDDDRFARWLELGYDGEMEYLGRHRGQRSRPRDHFAPYRSVIVLLVPYDDVPPNESPAIGNIARYALGDDYHDVIKRRLFAVVDQLRAEDPDLEARVLVDTAPLLEKVAAERAGLGWQGKHTNVIREDRGSWFFLAEILVNRDVPDPEPARDRCGICRDCIDVCPTGAIVAPYVLDARRCISYLTIELRGPIPRELRSSIGHRIFGCDDCQEVCPWNRFARESPVKELAARPGLRDRSLVAWMDMDLETWRRTFRRSAVKRAKFDGFKRNVAVALGNTRDGDVVPVLARALRRESPLVRAHVVWALREIGGVEAAAVLDRWAREETDPLVRAELDEAGQAPPMT